MESTAEFTRDDLTLDALPLRVVPRVTVACKTDLGRVRENNEDKFEYYIPEDERLLAARGQIFLVCDGMGGHAAGQIASELTCKTFIDVYLHHASPLIIEAAKAAVYAANRFVLDIGRSVPGRSGMGTTLSGLLLCQDEAIVVQVGDSRLYRLRDGDLRQLSEEHTEVEEMVQAGVLARAEAEGHPRSHVLTRAIGAEETVMPQVVSHELNEGDVFLLCSDGLTNHIPDEAIADYLRQYPPGEVAWRLVNAAIAAGGRDNCTCIVVRVDALESR